MKFFLLSGFARLVGGFKGSLDAPHRNLMEIETIRFALDQRFNVEMLLCDAGKKLRRAFGFFARESFSGFGGDGLLKRLEPSLIADAIGKVGSDGSRRSWPAVNESSNRRQGGDRNAHLIHPAPVRR